MLIAPRLTVSTAEAAIDAAAAGFGITRVLSYQAADVWPPDRWCRLLARHDLDDLPVHVLYPGGRHSAPKLRAFVDFAVPRLRQRLAQVARVIAGSGESSPGLDSSRHLPRGRRAGRRRLRRPPW